MSNLTTINFSAKTQGDADAVHGVKIPVGMTLVGVMVFPAAIAGSPTAATFDVNAGASAVVSALAVSEAGTAATWLSRHLGGSNAPVALAKDTALTVDVNLAGGTSPTVSYDVTLWLLAGTL